MLGVVSKVEMIRHCNTYLCQLIHLLIKPEEQPGLSFSPETVFIGLDKSGYKVNIFLISP